MNQYATKAAWIRVIVWIVWFLAVLVALGPSASQVTPAADAPLLGVVSPDAGRSGPVFPWSATTRWKKWALHKYRVWQAAARRAQRAAQLAQWALQGVLTMAHVVDGLTARQVRYKLGALPVLYALLETLQVRQIINRHCPTQADVDHGTVALVLVLNRLLLPLPLYQITDWVGQTVLVAVLGIPAGKFNDDRLGRTLDALYPHLGAIWLEIVEVALQKTGVDLSVIFYDVTAVVAQGRFAESKLIDFGFAHNTPNNKRKLKLGLDAAADGNLPLLYQAWSGRTADQATVETNLDNLAHWLRQHGQPLQDTLIVGDRAMLNAEIALLYDRCGLRHLTGLKAATPALKATLGAWSDAQIEAFPIVEGPNPQYWGRGCQVTFTHAGKTTVQRGLVVVAGPLRDQLRQARLAGLAELEAALAQLRDKLGQPRLRSVKAVQRRVNAQLRASPAAQFLEVTVSATPTGQINLYWRRNPTALAQVERGDGRYLLVTNDRTLSHHEMLRLYRQKDGVEKCFHVSKDDLAISPLYLHQDQRIATMLLINMLALLAYTLLQRQVRQQGLQITTRRLIQRLEPLTLIETHCWDGSTLRRLAHVEPDLLALLHLVAVALEELVQTAAPAAQPHHLLATAHLAPERLLPDRRLC
jgi:transposase